MDILIVGLGGIGSVVADLLCKFLSANNNQNNNQYKVYLMDGDTYDQKNSNRQFFDPVFVGSNKAEAKYIQLQGTYPELDIIPVPEWANMSSLKSIQLKSPVIFSCVDNHATRKIISDFASSFEDVVLISGGNEFFTGNVQTYIKRGNELTHKIEEFHKEIKEPEDRSPENMSCEELAAAGSPQLIFTNLFAATVMLCVFYSVVSGDYGIDNIIPEEICFDIQKKSCLPKYRPINKKAQALFRKHKHNLI